MKPKRSVCHGPQLGLQNARAANARYERTETRIWLTSFCPKCKRWSPSTLLAGRSAWSAHYQFAVGSILHLQRMTGMRAAAAASWLGGDRQEWAVVVVPLQSTAEGRPDCIRPVTRLLRLEVSFGLLATIPPFLRPIHSDWSRKRISGHFLQHAPVNTPLVCLCRNVEKRRS